MRLATTECYFSVCQLLSRTTWTFTPRLCASTSALAIGAEVKLEALSMPESLALNCPPLRGWPESAGAAVLLQSTIKGPVVYRFAHVMRQDGIRAFQVRDGAR